MESTRRLACKRCQTRKIKCNRVQPCSNCVQSNHQCEYRTQDGRRHPVSHKYLSALETRLAYFESLIQKLKSVSDAERDEILSNVALDDHLSHHELPIEDQSQKSPTGASENSESSNAITLRSGPQGTLEFHGPTSMYLGEESTVPTSVSHTDPAALDALSIVRIASVIGVNDELIKETLPLFFLHQYPQYMFVYREAFLSDYYENSYGGKYWSYSLVYALCALGAPHSKHPETRSKAQILAKCAQEIVFTHCLTRPSPTTIQALLCLAFHEVGQGNASQGWLLSGMAFRMGQDIGFHQDPMRWVLEDQTIVTAEDVEIRRRIYWGSYVADKFVSLYLGRPVYLREDDATVHPSEALPDVPPAHALFRITEIASQFASPQKPQLTLGLQYTALLCKIFQDMMTDIFTIPKAGKTQKTEAVRLSKLGELNLRFNRWHNELPEPLQWSQWASGKQVFPNVLVLHLFYHALILSLNRHFIRPTPSFPLSSSSRETCASSCALIITLIRQFRSQEKGLHSAPLMLVYALVMAIMTQVHTLGLEKESITFLLRYLEECTKVYKLAADANRRLSSLSKRTGNPIQAEDNSNTNIDTGEARNGAQGMEGAQRTHLDGSLSNSNLSQHELDMMGPTMPLDSSHTPFPQTFDDIFGLPELNDIANDFHGWFSIGQMG